ncbi:hypothetical protein DLJ46_04580 [Micromonospora globispora]|uniref:Uncharacterized protein n=1 Tax=Micromonospora globispora TaxID=1450148 RepID=A0A317KDQ4_9ACTN|nr:hypothetical protein [Micromonospora globispora]PWU51628.1 hypothetical protein DLJ46_04580 [Micromonospora globispora]RQW81930.1 hypothetical protein DKL51_34100 [Micromonospora globispora]
MTAPRAFWLDEQVDRERGAHGRGRYETEVAGRLSEFAHTWGDIAPVAFAVTAWRVATTLSPGYVRWHRRIVSATCERSPWDGSLTCAVTLVSGWPAELTWTRQWQQDRGWRDWPQVFGQYVTPSERDLTRVPHLRATLRVEAPVPLEDLPPAPDGPGGSVASTAHRAVAVLTRELDALLAPMIGQLDAGVPAES